MGEPNVARATCYDLRSYEDMELYYGAMQVNIMMGGSGRI